jgi:hypothetical protein
MSQFKVGDVVLDSENGIIYEVLGIKVEDSTSNDAYAEFYVVNILQMEDENSHSTLKLGRDEFYIDACINDELLPAYKATRQFDKDLEDLLDE